MCGIYGVYNFGTGELASRELLSEMDRLIFHRGPDDSGMRRAVSTISCAAAAPVRATPVPPASIFPLKMT